VLAVIFGRCHRGMEEAVDVDRFPLAPELSSLTIQALAKAVAGKAGIQT
jgi:hypothetical protein